MHGDEFASALWTCTLFFAGAEAMLCNGTGSKYSNNTLLSLLYLEQDKAGFALFEYNTTLFYEQNVRSIGQ